MSSRLWALACLDFSTFCIICEKHIGFVWRSITLIIWKVTQQVRIPQWENRTVFLNLLHKGVTLVFTNDPASLRQGQIVKGGISNLKESPPEVSDLKIWKNHLMKGVISNLKKITTWREGSQNLKESPHEGRDLKLEKNHHLKGVILKLERITTWREWS